MAWSGGEPQREFSGGVLKQHGNETLQRAERGTVNHHRTVLLIVGACVFQLEALGEVVVNLNGAELPAAANGVLDHEVKFRAIEGCLTKFLACIEAFLLARLDDSGLCKMPVLVAADIFLLVFRVAKRNLSLEVIEVQSLEYIEDNIHDFQELILDLVGGHRRCGRRPE